MLNVIILNKDIWLYLNKNMKGQLIFYGIRPAMELIESGKEIDTIYLQI